MFQEMSFLSSSESMKKVQQGRYAYIYFKSNLNIIVKTEYTNANGETDLHVASEEFFPGGYAWAFPKVIMGPMWFKISSYPSYVSATVLSSAS